MRAPDCPDDPTPEAMRAWCLALADHWERSSGRWELVAALEAGAVLGLLGAAFLFSWVYLVSAAITAVSSWFAGTRAPILRQWADEWRTRAATWERS